MQDKQPAQHGTDVATTLESIDLFFKQVEPKMAIEEFIIFGVDDMRIRKDLISRYYDAALAAKWAAGAIEQRGRAEGTDAKLGVKFTFQRISEMAALDELPPKQAKRIRAIPGHMLAILLTHEQYDAVAVVAVFYIDRKNEVALPPMELTEVFNMVKLHYRQATLTSLGVKIHQVTPAKPADGEFNPEAQPSTFDAN